MSRLETGKFRGRVSRFSSEVSRQPARREGIIIPQSGIEQRERAGYLNPPLREIAIKRELQDIIPPENFPRLQLDRPIVSINALYRASLGLEKTPIQTATEKVRSNGRVELFDVGCGTGHTVKTWAMAVANSASCPVERIGMTGISLYDYRHESRHPSTIQAHREGGIDYVIGDAAHMNTIEDNSKDVMLANASLIHSHDPVAWMKEMVRVAKPGGVLYFDLSEAQNFSDTPVMNFLFEREDRGYTVDIMPTLLILGSKRQIRVFCRLEKPTI